MNDRERGDLSCYYDDYMDSVWMPYAKQCRWRNKVAKVLLTFTVICITILLAGMVDFLLYGPDVMILFAMMTAGILGQLNVIFTDAYTNKTGNIIEEWRKAEKKVKNEAAKHGIYVQGGEW